MGFQVYNSQGQELQNLTGSAGGDLTGTYPNPTISAYVMRTDKFFFLQDSKASGSAGGTFTSGSWQTRALASATNNITNASVTSNQISLPAGQYFVSGWATAHRVNHHKTRIYNVTTSASLINGSSEYASATSNASSSSVVNGYFNLGGTTTIELQHRCETTNTTYGCGTESAFGENEIYSQLFIWKVG